MKIGHIGITVSDLERSLAFYEEQFGFVCKERYHFEEKGLTIALCQKDNCVLELFAFESFEPLPQYRKTLATDLKTIGVKHFSVEVDDIAKTFDAFKQKNIVFETELQTFSNGAQYFFIKDPDGILIEIMSKI